MNKSEIQQKIDSIINEILSRDPGLNFNEMSIADKMNIIISESSQALEFVTTVEDEFDIELDDDDIDLDFFIDINTMIERLNVNITNKSQ
ncbi:hypothetical protein [Pedobacter sp. GR22-10]|uniref:hypothetical protein n=1 Tax=Pedobacter sp. GR22-10 TaxID=2994472 RepID=UPI0022476436|nr:hypothetical protein [Pedobacter sp. GR22-10]MCX2431624.1 hypothetical protein [Pedobacter sp. GR22-10]